MGVSEPARAREIAVHRAPWVLPVSREPLRDGAIVVADGAIAELGSFDCVLARVRAGHPDASVHEWSGAIIPGLVNAHTHLQYTALETVGSHRYSGFEDWSRAFQVAYEQVAREDGHDWADSATDGLARAIATGTTAVAEVVTDLAALGVVQSGGVRGISYWELLSWRAADWRERGAEQTAKLIVDSGVAEIGLSPHAPYSLDTPVLRDLTRLSRHLGVRRHLHLAESAWEAEYTLFGTGDLAEQWRNWGYGDFHLLKTGGSAMRPVPYAESVGALGPDLHVAHGIYVDARDREILRRHDTAVALCPRSNAVIGLDEPPVADYLHEGNRISVGTDSLSSSPSLDLLGDVGELYRLARAQGYHAPDLHRRLLEAATLGGAEALGRATGPIRFGSLEPGAAADFAVLDAIAGTAPDVLAHIVEAGEGTARATFIAGEPRWQAGHAT